MLVNRLHVLDVTFSTDSKMSSLVLHSITTVGKAIADTAPAGTAYVAAANTMIHEHMLLEAAFGAELRAANATLIPKKVSTLIYFNVYLLAVLLTYPHSFIFGKVVELFLIKRNNQPCGSKDLPGMANFVHKLECDLFPAFLQCSAQKSKGNTAPISNELCSTPTAKEGRYG